MPLPVGLQCPFSWGQCTPQGLGAAVAVPVVAVVVVVGVVGPLRSASALQLLPRVPYFGWHCCAV